MALMMIKLKKCWKKESINNKIKKENLQDMLLLDGIEHQKLFY